nr:hypothetical protein [Tanacetum cinerariifolium]
MPGAEESRVMQVSTSPLAVCKHRTPAVSRYRSILEAEHSRTDECNLNPLLQVCKYRFDDPEKEKLRNRYALKTLLEQNPDSFKSGESDSMKRKE